MSDVLQVCDEGHVRILRLSRPEKKNALSNELAWKIVTTVQAAAEDDRVSVIGITGSGDSFCAGLDLTPTADGERVNPLSAQDDLLDDLGWVGKGVTRSPSRQSTVAPAAISASAISRCPSRAAKVSAVFLFRSWLSGSASPASSATAAARSPRLAASTSGGSARAGAATASNSASPITKAAPRTALVPVGIRSARTARASRR